MPYADIQQYYSILGVQPGATTDEVKRAYRKKAVQLHPDRNKSATAHEDFILLTEAYEYLINGGKPEGVITYEQEWESAAQQRARRRAEYYANMDYKNFTESDFYKKVKTFDHIASNLVFVYAVLMAVVLPFVAVSLYGLQGLIPCSIIFLISLPMVIREVRRNNLTDSSVFMAGLYQFLDNRVFQVAILSFMNFFIYITIGLQTLVLFKYLAGAYGTAIVLGYLFSLRLTGEEASYQRHFYGCCLGPLVVNALLLLNFYGSKNEVTETYRYKLSENTTLIILEGNAYAQYPGIRVFIDSAFMLGTNQITYKFKEGLLGFRVMTAYQFIQSE